MKISIDCLPCIIKQALFAAELAGASIIQKQHIKERISKIFPKLSLTTSSPEMVLEALRLVYAALHIDHDIYAPLKEKSNQLAMSIYDELKTKISDSGNPLLTAVELAIAGNIIDYGAKTTLNIESEIDKILEKENIASSLQKRIFDYDSFEKKVLNTSQILYLADNAGETVFDRLLIETIKKYNPNVNVICAVKAAPILNDALEYDAYQCGLDQCSEIISSGSTAAGTVLHLCSKEFIALFDVAEMVISKGQGNFEALSSHPREIYFLFKIKCQIVAKEISGNVDDMILLESKKEN